MRQRIKCLWHQESTPSLIQYRNGWRCFGACQKTYSHEEVESLLGKEFDKEGLEFDDKEDIKESLEYIKTLPTKTIRSIPNLLEPPQGGFYVVWPDSTFYKYRQPYGKEPKYLGPKGHKPPLFWGLRKNSKSLFLIEGELNCLSLAQAFPESDHCSPGSATMFTSKNLEQYLTQFVGYDTLTVVLDNDTSGIKALIETKALFLYKLPFTKYILMDEDANEILCKYGKERLREEVQRADYK